MKNKNYRELHFSSSQLVIVFLAMLVLGIFIFLLGISVGKKQAQISARSEIGIKKATELPSETVRLPTQVAKGTPQQQMETPSKNKQEEPKTGVKPEVKAPAQIEKETPAQTKPGLTLKPENVKPKEQTPVSEKKNLYYIQVGAFADRNVALSFAKTFEKEGYPVRVWEPLPSDKKPVFRVRLGGYETQDEAVKVKTKLKSSSLQKKNEYFIIKS